MAVRGLTKTAALELGHDNIRVNSIQPGAIRTPLLADHAPDAAAMAATMEGAGVGLSAIPRVAEPEEITRLVLFVASDDASFSTGSEFIADGGLYWVRCRRPGRELKLPRCQYRKGLTIMSGMNTSTNLGVAGLQRFLECCASDPRTAPETQAGL
jgi:hypothetical protein